MKNSISVLLIIILFQSCVEEPNTDTTIDLIKKVETGLTTRVHIEGDSTWSIEERMEHHGVPGVSIAVINNGKIAWTKGYGVMDKESKAPVTEQTLFEVSNIGMPLTAYGALRLVEQNKVSLNEDINSYLKSWKLPDNEFTKKKKATIKNLLNHSAGINVHALPGYSADSSVPTLVETLNGTPPATNDPILVNKEPDESTYISDAGYAIIQQMMIDIEGKEFPEIMNELVLQPLEMNNSTFNQTLTAEQLTMAAIGYMADGSMVKGKRHTYPAMAPKGLWTNAEDLAKFIINLQQTLKGNSNKGLSKDMTALMLTPYGVSGYGPSLIYGLGFGIRFGINNKKDETYFYHWGWNQGFFGTMMSHRDKGYGVVVLTNSTYPGFNEELLRSVALAYQWDNYVLIYKKNEVKFFLDGNFEKSLDTYINLMKQDPNNPVIREANLNGLGYRFLSNNQTNVAHDVFKVNTILYPESSNVYDSYAEVCKMMGKIDLAILNYSKSLELNPQNNHAKDMLKELQKSE